ncbi:MAG TPA: hypothetical protein VHL08_00255 [Dongiaceae bacterium]|jgi:hypothetical protein|nr:hypothetical protein [Dongiaceae bacterium]
MSEVISWRGTVNKKEPYEKSLEGVYRCLQYLESELHDFPTIAAAVRAAIQIAEIEHGRKVVRLPNSKDSPF